MIYDLCNAKVNTIFKMLITAVSGDYKVNIIARIEKTEKFKILCQNSEQSDVFLPRQDHGACQTWNNRLYVFGGRRNVDDKTYYMNDIFKLEQDNKRWHNHSPKKGDAPAP